MTTLLAPSLSAGPAATRFFEGALRHARGPVAGAPFRLEPWQRDDLDLLLALTHSGHPMWREALWGVPRGCGKSPLAAGLALMELVRKRDRTDVLIGSGARDQARIVGDYARDMAQASPILRDFTRKTIGGLRVDRPGGRALRVLSAEGGLAHGRFPALGILDELHVFTTAQREELYNAVSSALHKSPAAWLLGITTAGHSLMTLLGELYTAMLRAPVVERTGPGGSRLVAMDPDAGRLMIWWGAPDEADVENPRVWRDAFPASWVSMETLAQQARRLPEAVFRRLILNQWSERSESVIRPAAWEACRDEAARIPAGGRVTLAVSANARRDGAALVAVCRLGDRVVVELVDAWDETDQGDLETVVGDAVEKAVRVWRVEVVAMDPLSLPGAWGRVQALGVGLYQGARSARPGMPQTDAFMEPATAELASLVERGVLAHAGEPRLRRAMLAAEARETRRGWRLARPPRVGDRRAENVEPALACAMGVLALREAEDAPRSVLW